MYKFIIHKIQVFFLSPILQCVLFFLFLTCRWKVYNKKAFNLARANNRPILICCWHSRFLLVSKFFQYIKLPLWAISSTHRDSQIMATILYRWGFKLIRGSSTRGWSGVLKHMIALFKKEDTIIALTNDGPKGPPHITKKGAVALAIKKRVQILAVSASASSFFILPSWDKTKLPKPFSTIHVQFSNSFKGLQNQNQEVVEISAFIEKNFIDLENKVKK